MSIDMDRRQFLGTVCATVAGSCMPSFGTTEKSEFDKCKEDILYFVDNYLAVNDTLNGKLKMTPQQREYLKRISTAPDYFFCAKGRQVGISTANNVFAYWKSIFFGPDHHVYIVEHNKMMCEDAEKMYGNISNSGEFLPTLNQVHFIVPSRLRGLDLKYRNNTLILDEFAFWSHYSMDTHLMSELEHNLMRDFLVNGIPDRYQKYDCNFIVHSTLNDPCDIFTYLVRHSTKGNSLVLPSKLTGFQS